MPGRHLRQQLLPQSVKHGATASTGGAEATKSTVITVVALGSLVIVASAALISFNKHLMSSGLFPFPVFLVMMHAAFSFFFALGLYMFRPSFFPSLTDDLKKVPVDRDLMAGVVPIAVFFTGQLVLSNAAFWYASVAFLQMLKESNVVLVYVLSVACSLEHFTLRHACVLLCVMFATLLTVEGEMNYAAMGLFIQAGSCLCESVKIVLQGVLLTGTSKKLDAMSYVLLVTPVCLVFLLALIAVDQWVLPLPGVAVPCRADLWRNRWLLPLNTILAFALNVLIALFIKSSSAVSFVLVGIVKDAVIVISGALLLREPISKLQGIGFTLQLCSLSVWSLMKTFPDKFERGILTGLTSMAQSRWTRKV